MTIPEGRLERYGVAIEKAVAEAFGSS